MEAAVRLQPGHKAHAVGCLCRECHGHGWVPVDVYTRGEVWYSTSDCPACNGTGRQAEKVREVRND